MHPAADSFHIAKMFEDIDDYAIIFLDREGNIDSWNAGAEKIKGYTSNEVLGKNFRIFYTQEDIINQKPEKMISEAIRNGKSLDEGWRVCKNGLRFWGSIRITALYDDHGELIGFSKITRDLTEKFNTQTAIEKYMQKLEIQNKELEQFVYIASHDLQEPLLTVSSFIDLLKEEYSGTIDPTGEMYLGFIAQSTERMRSLIKGLLDYARLGKKKEVGMVDCNALIEEVKIDLFSVIERSGAKIIYGNLPVVKGFVTELRLLFQNLISNSLKFSKKEVSPVIRISAQPTRQGWQFSVTDNGIGIEDRFKERIFVIFQRLHNRTDYEGNGIGLAHCKKITELHGGKISVESSPGNGSSFHFTLNLL